MKTIKFYFDFVSSNVYLAWTQLRKLQTRHDIIVEPVPVLFAGLLNSHGNVGPAEIPAKRFWMLKNTLRKAAHLNVPLNPPIHHPFNPLPALRACCVDMPNDKKWAFISALLDGVWVHGLHISEADVIARLADEAGLDGQKIVAQTAEGDIKDRLKQNTEEAIRHGIFGIPSFRADEEVFFGYDDFPYLDLFLQGKDPLNSSNLDAWDMAAMQASSVRTRPS